MSTPWRVCYWGAYDPAYPRNNVNRKGLRLAGVDVTECRVGVRLRTPARLAGLIRQFLRGGRGANILLVAEFCHTLVPWAWILARSTGAKLVFDPAVSMHDINVNSRRHIAEHSLRADYLWKVDWLAFRLPDLLIWYTEPDRMHFAQTYGVPVEHTGYIWAGVDTDLYRPLPQTDDSRGKFVVHYNGSFLPTHGVDVIIHAAALLKDRTEVTFELYGKGPCKAEAEALVKQLGLSTVKFFGRLPAEEIVQRIARAHACLGSFGADSKNQRLFVLKAGQAMACKRAVITADTPGARAQATHGEDILLCQAGDPTSLAEAILALYDDAHLRQRLAEAGYWRAVKTLSPEKIGQAWVEHFRRLDIRPTPYEPLGYT